MRFPYFRLGSRWRKARRTPRQPPRLAIVTCIKNEGEDLVEWLCFHRFIGVSRFVIYDNLSTDATQRILEAVPFRDEITIHSVLDEAAQKFAFRDALRRYRRELDWVTFIDGDEFIVPLGETSIVDKLREFEDQGVNGFGINWRIFGSSGHKLRPPGLVTESFIRRAPNGYKPNQHVKSVVKMAAVESMVTQHYFRVRGRYLLDNQTSPPADFEGVAPEATFSQGFALHHYITKSNAQCMKKVARGRPRSSQSDTKFRNPRYCNFYDRNEVEDRRAAEVVAPISENVLHLRDEIDAAVLDKAAPN
jgi:hypothetical protein